MKNKNAIGNLKNVNNFLVCMNPSLIKYYILDSATLYLYKGNRSH